MGSDGSVAPKERVNIVYKPATGDAQEEVELPLKLVMMGDYTGREDDRPLEDRKPININKDNFKEVMRKQELGIQINVADKLSNEEGAELTAKLKFNTLDDFSPEGVVNQVPEMRKLLDLRNALVALKGPLGNIPAFRRLIQSVVSDEKSREKLLKELDIES